MGVGVTAPLHGRAHRAIGSDPIPPGAWHYATPLAPASNPDDLIAGDTQSAPFLNGWGNVEVNGDYSPLAWRITTKGRVEIVGSIDGGALGTVCVVLPQAFRPVHDITKIVASADGTRIMSVSVAAATGYVTVLAAPSAGPVDGGSITDESVTEAKLDFSDITTANASTAQHGLLRKLDGNSAHFLDGTGAWVAPPGGAPTGSAGGVLDGTYPNPGLAATVAGNGLAETSDVLSVNVDGSTLEISADSLRVKDAGVTSTKMSATGVSASSYGDSTNVPQITVDAAGRITAASNVSITGSGSVAAADGWTDDTAETWTFASSTTFTVTGNLTTKYPPGTRIKLTQTTVKYFVVASSSHSSGTTTVTITGGTDYTLANAAISANYHSYAANPQGYPDWFNYTPTFGGFSSGPTVNASRFSVEGRTVTVIISAWPGTSNATTLTWTTPIPWANVNGTVYASCRVENNGAFVAGGMTLNDGTPSSQCNVYRDGTGLAFTNSGAKGFYTTFVYQI